ncbi:MAG TPA: tetratricopeptide repeat protein [Acidobacteriota bacterium]|jgi:tetratricopeptide (TPR) repeat protein|nr:tetratricopeptide repeat protein [Acidobacteriota bacterium]
MNKLSISALALALAVTPSFALQAAQTGQQQTPQTQPGQQPAPAPKPPRVVGQAQTQEEFQAYQTITQTSDAQQRAKLIEDFFQKYPDSGLTFWMQQVAVSTYQQLNNPDKLVEHGEAALRSWEKDNQALSGMKASPAVILTMLANAYAERGKPDPALERADKAIAEIEKLQPPPGIDAAQFASGKNQLLETVYASKGVAYLAKTQDARAKKANEPKPPTDPNNPAASNQKKDEPDPNLEAAITNLNKAIELNPKDDFVYFRLGIAYTLKNDAERAIDYYAKAVALSGYVSKIAKENLEKVYKLTHDNKLDGLDQRIAKAKESLNAPPAPTPPPPAVPQQQKPPSNR